MIPFDDAKALRFFFRLLGVGVVFGICSFLIFRYWINTYEQVEYKDGIRGTIIKVKPYQSVALIATENNMNLKLMSARNYRYDPYSLNEFLKVGDSIYKKSNSDSLMIKRSDKEYYFIMGKYLNKHLRNDLK